ncbi:TetR/AcrR family transcriptional regulator [Aureimonas flava]|uniref:TetR/AcrR family transcriptional regulator n=1 Tax=Aureimonas flava TaxID=2320271 RepID=A0A3A1WN74_9HYPH|nr:TetR/AcrR family transcriptional regulator [Aureimonas flava]RIY02529.1 TetR/AcrR family transcriptional regulator [Aureimonas flava]
MEPDPPKATRRPRADSARNRERLLVAAAEVFRAGDGRASLEAVARRAGVGIGTLYRHFPTREALFEAVYRREVEQLVRLAETLAVSEPPLPALRLWLREEVRLVATKRGMLAALALAVDSGSELYAFSFRNLSHAVGTLLDRCVAAGDVRGDVGPEDLLQTLVGLCLMAREPDWESNVVRLMDVFVDGMRVGAGAPPAGGTHG